MSVDGLQRGEVDVLVLGLNIQDLPADHTQIACAKRQFMNDLDLAYRIEMVQEVRAAAEIEGQGQQGVSCEDRHGFPVHLVVGQLPPPVVVVVHGREIVVDERIGVNQLERRRDRQDGLRRLSHRLSGRHRQDRADALAAGEQTVAHAFVQGGGGGLRRGDRGVEEPIHLLAFPVEV